MKKTSIIASILVLLSTILSADITIKNGWQLLGATQDINTSIFDSTCIDYIWKYDATDINNAQWQVHIANAVAYNNAMAPITSLVKGEGYWVLGNSECNITVSEPAPQKMANIGVDQSIIVGESAQFNAPTGDYNYYWFIASRPTGSTASFGPYAASDGMTFLYADKVGTYLIGLVVNVIGDYENTDADYVYVNATPLESHYERTSETSDTVKDLSTNYIWQDSQLSIKNSYAEAAQYCADLTLDEGGWRLPSIDELCTLFDSQYTPSIDPTFHSRSARYWTLNPSTMTGTTYAVQYTNNSCAYAPISFDGGSYQPGNPYVRCLK